MGGYQSAFLSFLSYVGETGDITGSQLNNIKLMMVAAIAGGVVVAMSSGGSSLGRSSALIVFFGTFILNFTLIPLSFVADATLPDAIKLFVLGFMQLLIVLAAIDLMVERDV